MEKKGWVGKVSGRGTESLGMDGVSWVGSGFSAAPQAKFLPVPAATTIPLISPCFLFLFLAWAQVKQNILFPKSPHDYKRNCY